MVIELLNETQALLKGHYMLSSGKHSDGYVQCAKLLQYPEKAEKALAVAVEKVRSLDIDKVVGPAMGGVIVSYEVGRQLNKPSIFTERVDGEMTIRRGFEIKEGDRVLITEDVVTTGKSAIEAIKAVEKAGGIIVGVLSLIDRTDGNFKYPLYSSVKVDINTYEEEDCPLCKRGLEIEKPGSRFIKK